MNGEKYFDPVDKCLKCASQIHCVAVRIYNLIREVGHGELSADNALHQMVEDYKVLKDIADGVSGIADTIEAAQGKGGAK